MSPTESSSAAFLSGGGECGALLRATDWNAHPLGPPDRWPIALQTLVGTILQARQPMFVAWGEELRFLYNDPYAEILGAKHPGLGLPFSQLWSEIWGQFQPIAAAVMNGEGLWFADLPIVMDRRGEAEQTWFSFSYTPVRDDRGVVAGVFCACTETTDAVRGARDLAAASARAGQLTEAVDRARQSMLLTDPKLPDNPIVFANPAFLDLTGYEVDEVMGRNCRFLQGPETDPEAVSALRGAIAEAREISLELLNHRKDGSAFWNQLTVSPIRDDAGQVVRFLATQLDVTARRVAEQALRVSEAKARAIIDGAKDHAIFTTNAEGVVDSWSEGAEAIFGWTEAEIVGRSGELIFTPEDRAAGAHARELNTAAASGCAADERWHLRKDGSRVFMNGSVRPLRAPDGGLRGFVKVARDETERRYQASLRDAQQRVLELALRNAPLPVVLTELVRTFEALSSSGMIGSILLLDDDRRLRLGAAPNLPDAYNHAIDGLLAAPGAGSRGTAAHTGEAVFVGDIAADPLWTDFRDLARAHHLAACWSTPILSNDGEVLGTFAMYYREPREPTPADLELVATASRSASLLLERRQDADRLSQAQERLRLATLATNDAIWDWDLIKDQVQWNAALAEAYGHDQPGPDGGWWLEQIHPDDRDRVSGSIHAVIDGVGARWTGEYRFRRADGAYADVLDRGFVVRGEGGQAVRMIGAMLDLSARKASEEALRDLASRLRLATEATQLGIFDWDLTTGELGWDDRTRALFGLPPGAPVDYTVFSRGLHPDDRARTEAAVAAAIDTERLEPFEVEYRTIGIEDGVERWLAARGRPELKNGAAVRFVGAVLDISQRKLAELELHALKDRLEDEVEARTRELQTAEESLRQAQKMEAIGQLTGGIAHDFNNLLTGIIGSLDLIRRRIDAGRVGEIDRFMDAATTSANRAAALTHRLLAFARRQSLDTRAVDVNALSASMEELLQRTIGEQIDLRFELGAGVWQATTDANQLESALLNLAINARDAMPDGGKLTVETANTRLDESYTAQHQGLQPGDYVVICVSDTGMGMTADVIERAFDPFFTTKPIGQGTGLGLSMIYGFARQSGGHARIYSEPGRGTTVKLYLPRHLGELAVEAEGAEAEAPLGAGETVLVVEDDSAVRLLVTELLAELGYQVLEAHDGPSALPILNSDARIDLMVSDVGLPGLNGRQLAESARAVRPALKVLFITGYAENAAVRSGFLGPDMEMITKPFAIDALATKVREMLAGEAVVRAAS